MPSYPARALVLRKTKLGETDTILTLLAADGRQVRAVAKGLRKPGGRFGARLEPFAVVDLLLHTGRSLDVITEAQTVATHAALREDFDRSAAATVVADLLDKISVEGQAEPQLFALATTTLDVMEQAPVEALPALVVAFLVKAMAMHGYRPQLESCACCAGEAARRAGSSRWHRVAPLCPAVRRSSTPAPCGSAPKAARGSSVFCVRAWPRFPSWSMPAAAVARLLRPRPRRSSPTTCRHDCKALDYYAGSCHAASRRPVRRGVSSCRAVMGTRDVRVRYRAPRRALSSAATSPRERHAADEFADLPGHHSGALALLGRPGLRRPAALRHRGRRRARSTRPRRCARSVPTRGAPPTCSRLAVRPTGATARTPTACSTTTSTRSSSSRRPTTCSTCTSTRCAPSASSPPSTTCASSRTTGSRRRSARGVWAGKSGSTAWRSRSSPTSSRSAASSAVPFPPRSPTASSGSRCTSRASTASTTSSGRSAPTVTTFTYGDVFLRNEQQYSAYNFEVADVDMLLGLFTTYEAECRRTLDAGLRAAGLRLRAQVLARVQPARRARRHQRDRAPGLHPARPCARQGVLRGLPRARRTRRADEDDAAEEAALAEGGER